MDTAELAKYKILRDYLSQNIGKVLNVNDSKTISVYIEEENENFRMFVGQGEENIGVEHFPANLFLAAKILSEQYKLVLIIYP
jgi:hypothetical protein